MIGWNCIVNVLRFCPKKTARSELDENASLTVVGTVLVQIIFQEVKGTGNLELILNRKLGCWGQFLTSQRNWDD